MNVVFVTGGSGFLGAMLINRILDCSSDRIIALVRGRNEKEAFDRLSKALIDAYEDAEYPREHIERIEIVTGDITLTRLGMAEPRYAQLARTVNHIFHSAALTDLTLSLGQMRKVNVEGTRNVLELADRCAEKGALKKVSHVSTAYIAGTRVCRFTEKDLDIGQDFNNTYEQSKFEAEKVVCDYRRRSLDIDVFRPSIVLGRSSDGKTTSFKMFYQPLHLFAMELYDEIPAISTSCADMVNIDFVVKAIYEIAKSPERRNMTYHIVSRSSPTLEEVLDSFGEFFKVRTPRIVAPENFDMRAYSPVKRRLIAPFLPYFRYGTRFSAENADRVIEAAGIKAPIMDRENLMRLYSFCDRKGFMRRKGTRNAIV